MNRQDVGAVIALALVALSGAIVIGSRTAEDLDNIRGIRVGLDARDAVARDKKVKGELTIVRGLESEKYYFLNKKIYLVHTSSKAKEGDILTAESAEDKARADRHAEATRKKQPLRKRFENGVWRVTVPDNDRSAELSQHPPIPQAPSPWRPAFYALLGGLIVLAVLRIRLSTKLAAPAAAATAALVLLLMTGPHYATASNVATAFLAEGRTSVPIVQLRPQVTQVILGGVGIVGVLLSIVLAGSAGARALEALSKERHAYVAISPAMLGLGVLVGIPFVFGIGLAFFRHRHGTYSFTGIDNFIAILTASGQSWFEPRSLPYALVITIVWTALNVFFHVTIGLLLAMALQNRAKHLSKIYRVFLIIPWAVPAYLTALIWRSMFDPDIGVVNRVLGLEGFSWMHDTTTAFLANLVTNVWLGFPFMMVVCLGALTSIPKDLYEAAEVDGASAMQQFFRITLPLLKPALLPAVILGSIWTFNKFEVIYLVSEGKPDGGTEILVTEAYKWAFERGIAQGGAYGYAAAYSVIIFLVLLLYGWMTSRVSRAAEDALR